MADQDVEPVLVRPGLVGDARECAGAAYEEFRRLVTGERVVRLAHPMHQDDAAARLQATPDPIHQAHDITGIGGSIRPPTAGSGRTPDPHGSIDHDTARGGEQDARSALRVLFETKLCFRARARRPPRL